MGAMSETVGRFARRLSDFFAHSRKHYRSVVAWPILALILGVLGWLFLLNKLHLEKVEIEAALLKEAAVSARSYADYLAQTLSAIDQIVLHLRYEWEITSGAVRLEHARERGLFPSAMLFQAGILDRNGVLLTATFQNEGGTIMRALQDRPYFTAHAESNQDFLYIGTPTLTRNTRRHVVQFSRRLSDVAGVFDGVVFVAMQPDYFTRTYDVATLKNFGFLGIMGHDQVLRAARTGATVHGIGSMPLRATQRFPTHPGSAIAPGETWFEDGRTRFLGWNDIEGHPLTALSGLDYEEAMHPYFARRLLMLRSAGIATLALAVLTLTAMIFAYRLSRRKQEIEGLRATYRQATEEGNEGFYILRPIYDGEDVLIDCTVIDCNQQGAAFYQRRREDFLGMRLSSIFLGDALDRLINRLRQAVAYGSYESEVKGYDDGPFASKWIHVKIVRSGSDLAATVRDITETKTYVENLERLSSEDALTRLPNRHWIQTYLPGALQKAADQGQKLALLFVDLDDFKAVNDTLGHSAGDELLRFAAKRLQSAVRPNDHVARLGGDEFVVVLEHIAEQGDASHVAERVLEAFQRSFNLTHGIRTVGASIGISLFPDDGTDAPTLLHNADVAMYSVKTQGKDSYCFFDARFYDALKMRLERKIEIKRAIVNDEFIIYYQPRVDMASGCVCSLEALVRWTHPEKGLLGPLDFIPIAEENNLILELGELIVRKVCQQQAQWSAASHDAVPVSINVSPRQFHETDIVGIFARLLKQYGVDARLVEIEVTESATIGDDAAVTAVLNSFHEMGVVLCIDDFGTGYSSLSQLQRLDFDVLKVDQAFTSRIDQTEQGSVFVKAIITMAHALGMRVVAEGVETERQVNILKALDCDEIQGFFISKPLPAADTQRYLHGLRPAPL